jgi:hypothetical protein
MLVSPLYSSQADQNKGLAEREGFEPSVPVLASTTV